MYHETQCGCGQHGHEEKQGMGYGHGERRGHHGYEGRGGMYHGSGCGCHHGGRMHPGHSGFMRRHFMSKEEVITKLEEYFKQLQDEAKGVEERIAQLKKDAH